SSLVLNVNVANSTGSPLTNNVSVACTCSESNTGNNTGSDNVVVAQGGTPAHVTKQAGDGQHANINTAFPTNLKVLITDAGNNPVPNASVTFTAPASGASGAFQGATNTTTFNANGSGVATAPV